MGRAPVAIGLILDLFLEGNTVKRLSGNYTGIVRPGPAVPELELTPLFVGSNNPVMPIAWSDQHGRLWVDRTSRFILPRYNSGGYPNSQIYFAPSPEQLIAAGVKDRASQPFRGVYARSPEWGTKVPDPRGRLLRTCASLNKRGEVEKKLIYMPALAFEVDGVPINPA